MIFSSVYSLRLPLPRFNVNVFISRLSNEVEVKRNHREHFHCHLRMKPIFAPNIGEGWFWAMDLGNQSSLISLNPNIRHKLRHFTLKKMVWAQVDKSMDVSNPFSRHYNHFVEINNRFFSKCTLVIDLLNEWLSYPNTNWCNHLVWLLWICLFFLGRWGKKSQTQIQIHSEHDKGKRIGIGIRVRKRVRNIVTWCR